jgi:hypothetical protein
MCARRCVAVVVGSEMVYSTGVGCGRWGWGPRQKSQNKIKKIDRYCDLKTRKDLEN